MTPNQLVEIFVEFFKKYEGVESVIMRYYKEKTIKTEAEIQKEREEKEAEIKKEEGKDEVKQENGDGAEKKTDGASSEPQLVWIKKFKGSIFVSCKTIEHAKKILEDTIVFHGAPIVSISYGE